MPPAKSRYRTPSAPWTCAPSAATATMAGAETPRATQRSRSASSVSGWICDAVMGSSLPPIARGDHPCFGQSAPGALDFARYPPLRGRGLVTGEQAPDVRGGEPADDQEQGGGGDRDVPVLGHTGKVASDPWRNLDASLEAIRPTSRRLRATSSVWEARPPWPGRSPSRCSRSD